MKAPVYEYCQHCGQALTKDTDTLYHCPEGHIFYNNPVAAAGVVLVNDAGKVLFAKRDNDPAKGKYKFPGGFVHFGESVEGAARRELLEEAGIELGEVELVGSVCNFYFDNYTTADNLYICKDWQGDPTPQDDVEALEWHPLEFMLGESFAWPEAFRPSYDILKAKI